MGLSSAYVFILIGIPAVNMASPEWPKYQLALSYPLWVKSRNVRRTDVCFAPIAGITRIKTK
jgi:hypothetical protein